MPENISLGRVEVSCEGYSDKQDPYVLVGSCSLTYTLNGDVSPGCVFLFLFCFACLAFLHLKKKESGTGGACAAAVIFVMAISIF